MILLLKGVVTAVKFIQTHLENIFQDLFKKRLKNFE